MGAGAYLASLFLLFLYCVCVYVCVCVCRCVYLCTLTFVSDARGAGFYTCTVPSVSCAVGTPSSSRSAGWVFLSLLLFCGTRGARHTGCVPGYSMEPYGQIFAEPLRAKIEYDVHRLSSPLSGLALIGDTMLGKS